LTQYPNPYPPPPGAPGFDYYRPMPPRDPLAPAKRASVMLFVLGGLAVLGGLCIGTIVWIMPLDQVINQAKDSLSPQQLSQLPPGMSLEHLVRIVYTVLAVLGVGFGVLLLGLGPAVRRGRRGATITAIVLFVLVGLFCLLNLFSALLQLAGGSAATAIASLVFVAVLGAVVILALVFLFQAIRVSGYAAWHQQQMQAHYWHHQQQQAAYSQSAAAPPGYGYGYGAPPPQQQAPTAPPSGALPPSPQTGETPGDQQA